MSIDIKAIKARRQAITMGEGDWHRMEYEDGSLMPDYLSAGQSKEGYSLDVIISEWAIPENIEFICHCPVDIDNLVDEIERLKDILTTITTKHNLLMSVSVYGPCKCKGSVLCMKHAAEDILKMIKEAE